MHHDSCQMLEVRRQLLLQANEETVQLVSPLDHIAQARCLWSTEAGEPSFSLSHLISPPFSSLLLSSYPRSSGSFHSAEQIPQRRLHYFTSGTELSHCEQHIAGINAHQLAKLCAFSKWVAGFRGTRASRRPLRDCSPVKLVAFAPAVLRMLRFAFVFRSVLPV